MPSNWDARGFGVLSYRNESTNAFDEQGLYERDFSVPADWSGRRVFLVFDGVMTDTRASLNHESVGPMHQGGFYRFKYELTKLLKFDSTNRVEVTVNKHSANATVNRAERAGDYWLFGGIYRPVYLEAVPSQFIERVAVDARADGALTLDVFASGVTGADTIEAQVAELEIAGQTVVSLPQAGLAFLDAIPPIGSKFHPARDGGPQSQTNIAHGEYTGSVSFYFGKLP